MLIDLPVASPWPPSRWVRAVVIAAVMGASSPAIADAAGADAQGDLRPLRSAPLLGGYRILEALGIAADVPRAQIVPILVRRFNGAPGGSRMEAASARAAFLETLSALERVARALVDPRGLALDDARLPESRPAVRQRLATVGLELVEQRDTLLTRFDASRDAESLRRALSRGGIDVLDVLNRLNGGERIHVAVPSIAIPLPLDEPSWARLLGRRDLPGSEWLGAILRDRRASLVAYGLLGMDAESRAWLASTPDALRGAWDNPAGFAIAARDVEVRAGVLQLPGGTTAIEGWERLVGTPASRPAAFLRQVFGRDSGRLAYFVDAIAQLDEAHLRFVLAQHRRTRDPLRELYATVADAHPEWDTSQYPFQAPQIDTPFVLRSIVVGADGVPAGPSWRALWMAVADGEPPSSSTVTETWLQKEGAIDAVWIATYVTDAPLARRRERLWGVMFAQRVFPSAAVADAADIGYVLAHYAAYPMLPLTLERLGIRTASVHAAAVRAAAAVAALDRDRRPVALAQLQGALVLLVRLRERGALTAAAAETAARELFLLRLHESRLYEGRVAEWMAAHLAPAWQRAGDLEEIDEAPGLVAVLAGRLSGLRPLPFEWEGARYATTTVDYERARLQRGFDSVRGAAVDAVLALSSAVSALRSAPDVEALHAAVTAAERVLEGPGLVAPGETSGDVRDLVERAQGALRDLRRIRRADDLDEVADRTRPLLRLTDWTMAEALRTVAYLVSLPAENLANAADLAARHDFGLDVVPHSDERERAAPWLEPVASSSGGAHVRGSLLGLDAAHAVMALRRLTTAPPPRPPTLGAAAIGVLAHTVALSGRTVHTDDDRDAIAAAVHRGRERIARWAADSGRDALEPEVPRSEWRAAALEWARGEGAEDVFSLFTLHEILALGSPGPVSVDGAWGVSQQALSGCFCLATRPMAAWETLAGRPASAEPASHFLDLSVRIAANLSALQVPARLFPFVLAFAVQDLSDTASGFGDDDLMALTRATRALTDARVSDYVAAAIGRGAAAVSEAGPP